MNQSKINLNGFEFTYIKEDAEWIYKALPLQGLQVPAKEKAQIRVAEDIEGEYKKLFDKALVFAVKDIGRYLINEGV